MLSGLRISALSVGALVAISVGSAPASAQSLSQFGNWGEAPVSSSRSMLGAAPAMVRPPTALAQGGARPNISAKSPQTVAFRNGFAPGSIIIDTAGRKLYYTLSESAAYVYPVAVGKQGFAWSGVERVSRIEDWPDWNPPKEMRQRQPSLPIRMTGGVRNPLGAKAIYLGDTLYRIHGTNDSKSIGSASSSGCFRMHNAHVVHLAQHVDASTLVFVMRRMPKSGTVMPPAGYGPAPELQIESVATEPPAAEAEGQHPDPAAPQAVPQPDAGAAQPTAPADQGI